MTLSRLANAVLGLLLLAAPALASQPPGATSEYVPVPEGAIQSEQLPAGPLLVAAYAFFLAAVLFYVWTIWQRLNKVEAEMRVLEQKARSSGR